MGASVAAALLLAGGGGGYWAYSRSSSNAAPEGVPAEVGPLPTPGSPAPGRPVDLAVLAGGAGIDGALRLYTGDTIDLVAALTDSAGRAADGAVSWITEDPSVASVGPDGRLVGHTPGATTITIAGADLSRTIDVMVEAPTLRLALTTSEGGSVGAGIDLDMDATLALRATVLDEQGRATLGGDFAWRSSNAAVATVSSDGRIRGVGPGRASVTVAIGSLRQAVDVRVQAVVAELSVVRTASGVQVEDRIQLEVGATLGLSAVAYAPGRRRMEGLTAAWSSSDPAVVSIDDRGVITGRRAGETLVLVRVGEAVSDVAVEVTSPPPGTLVLTVRPYAYVTIDGARRDGEQRRLELSLPAGPHSLRLEHPTLGAFDTTFVVQPGVSTAIDKLLSAGGG